MKTVSELRGLAWHALVRDLGLADALRYRILFEVGEGNYVREREALFEGIGMDRWLEELDQWEREHPRRQDSLPR